jgi:putative membrane protein
MESRRKIWLTVSLLGLLGGIIFVGLLLRNGVEDVTAAFVQAGWWMAVVCAVHFVPLFLDTVAWWVLFPPGRRPGMGQLFWTRWAGEAVGNMLPATQVGGDLVRARLAAATGTPVGTCAATVVADITVSVFAQILFTLLGLGLLAWKTGQADWTVRAILGSAVAMGAIGGFYAVQRFGIFRIVGGLISKITSGDSWKGLTDKGRALDAEIRDVYARRRGVIASCTWTFISYIAGAAEVWVALYAVGANPSFRDAIILEAVGQGIRAAMFFMPMGLGVQEGGYVAVGALLGIPAPVALALSLIRRVRELAFGVPGLIGWQVIESKWALRGRAVPVANAEGNSLRTDGN